MSYFHDDDHGPAKGEPVPGLPEPLPEGESILWQGRPAPVAFAVHVFHIRFVLAYMVLMVGWRMASKASAGAPTSDLIAIATSGAILGAIGLALVFGLAWLIARSALFTLTEKRLVMRFGVAIRKYVNLPLAQIESADLRPLPRGRGDIALTTRGKSVGYVYLWPFARPLKFAPPYPSLRAIPDAQATAELIARTYGTLDIAETAAETSDTRTARLVAPRPAGTSVASPSLPGRAQPA